MRQSRLVTGRVPRDWEWGIVNTPEEWWLDYAVNHPDYDPYTLDSESGARLYGPQFRFLGDVSEEDPDGFYKFLIPHFGDSFKYLLVLNRYKEKTYRPIEKYDLNYPGVGSPFYDPMVETPDAYSHFCRISRLVNIGQSDKRVIKEVLKFVSKYGPPWYTEYAKLHTPPFCDPPNGPLTIDGILWESLNMASALHTYRLLQDLNEDIRAERTLRKHLADVFRRQNQSSGIHYNLTIVESKYTHVDWDYHTLPPLDTRTQLEQAAIAFVIGSVNCGLTTTGVKFGLTNKLGRGLSAGAWAPRYTFDNLLGAMWIQFYLEILEGGRLKECRNDNCRRLFPFLRSNKEYCSKECGVKQYMRDHRKKSNGGTK